MLAASVITPFQPDGALHEQALRHQLRRIAGEQVGVWLVSSGSAEANALSEAEMERVAEIAVDEVGGRTPVVAMGPEPKTAAASIAFARRMHGCGVDAVQVGPLDPGHSYLPSDAELRAFYGDVLGAIDGPAFLATHMSVGYDVPPSVLAELADADHVQGIIATQLREYAYVPRLLQAVDGRVPVVLGSPVHLLEALTLGARGVVSSLDVNVAPDLYRALGTAWAAQDLAAVNDAYSAILRLFLRLLGEGGLLLAKAVLDRLGLAAGPPRPPRRPPDEAVFQRADAIIEEFGLQL
jgi:4-hydroxy-tetrahydrodipicolinate synthase